ncbi:hypothetical protein [Helicovermis profundi]|uniref:Mannosyl-glycoprotein endo-beta-N-acetylglucosamidase-like domain-containing protein n=1 Tax=Helicovermis profundi TaxID=3065157 RepID=A0AAU9E342_9FIRM|nr:hypothetical protein HLPR_13050 [Clostridia bacterium S502]
MNEALIELKKNVILSKTIISQIKKNIEYQYSFASKDDKINLLSTELNKIINNNLFGIDYSFRNKIKNSILNEFIYKNNEITQYIIFNYLLHIELPVERKINMILKWFNKSTNIVPTSELIKKILISQTSQNEKIFSDTSDINIHSNIHRITNETNDEYFNKKFNFHFNLLYIINKIRFNKLSVPTLLIIFLFASIFIFSSISKHPNKYDISFLELNSIFNISKETYEKEVVDSSNIIYSKIKPGIPNFLKYQIINESSLKKYLVKRNSYLINEPYFSTIINISKDYNINPYLLFALTGQEQGFVPKTNKYAKRIANNPYNVFISWERYNTDIEDSTKIACQTINSRLKTRPYGVDPFLWLNSIYAEDPNWWKGFKSLFLTLKSYETKEL